MSDEIMSDGIETLGTVTLLTTYFPDNDGEFPMLVVGQCWAGPPTKMSLLTP